MPIKPVIRKAISADVPAMRECVHDAYRHYADRIGKPPGPMLDDYADVLQKHEAYVVEQDGAIVGVLVLICDEDKILLDNVAVQPVCQGRGIGRRLIGLAEARAGELGYTHLDLYTHILMTENLEMYRRLGYVETARRYVRGYHRVYMRKTLEPAD